MTQQNTTPSYTEEYKALNAQINALREQARDVAKKAFAEQAEKIFAAHEWVQNFSWTQYTPYFNDGDECIFGAHTDYPSINGVNDIAYADEDEILEEAEAPSLEAAKEAARQIVAFLSAFEDDNLKDMFGDHAIITVSRDGSVDVSHYDHD